MNTPVPTGGRRGVYANRREKPRTEVGLRIDRLLTDRGLSRLTLARMCVAHCKVTSFNRSLITGRIPPEALPIIASALGVTVYFLLTGLNDDPQLYLNSLDEDML